MFSIFQPSLEGEMGGDALSLSHSQLPGCRATVPPAPCSSQGICEHPVQRLQPTAVQRKAPHCSASRDGGIWGLCRSWTELANTCAKGAREMGRITVSRTSLQGFLNSSVLMVEGVPRLAWHEQLKKQGSLVGTQGSVRSTSYWLCYYSVDNIALLLIPEVSQGL